MAEKRAPLVTIAIPSAARRIAGRPAGYLTTTVRSVFSKLSARERLLVRIVILNCEDTLAQHPELSELLDGLENDRSLVSVVQRTRARLPPDKAFEPPIPPDDPKQERRLWWAQIKHDFVDSLEAARHTGAPVILRLEDDVVACDDFLSRLLGWVEKERDRPRRLPFVSLFSPDFGFDGSLRNYYAYAQAMLFWNDDRLDAVLDHLKERIDDSHSAEKILEHYRSPTGERGRTLFPSYFQHIGDYTSSPLPSSITLGLSSRTFREHHDPWSLLRHTAVQPFRFALFLCQHARYRFRQWWKA